MEEKLAEKESKKQNLPANKVGMALDSDEIKDMEMDNNNNINKNDMSGIEREDERERLTSDEYLWTDTNRIRNGTQINHICFADNDNWVIAGSMFGEIIFYLKADVIASVQNQKKDEMQKKEGETAQGRRSVTVGMCVCV